MIATGKFQDLVPTGISACKADRTHGRFCAGTDHPDHLYRGNRIDDHLCENGLLFSRGTEARAAVSCRFHGSDNVRMAVSEYHRPPRADIVDIFVAVDIV